MQIVLPVVVNARRAGAVACRYVLALATTLLIPGPGMAHAQPVRTVALTFDDLPMTGGGQCDSGLVQEVTASLTRVLASQNLPAAGLVSPGRACMAPVLAESLEQWRDAGAVLGNHTASHLDLNATPLDDYVADLDRGQALMDEAIATDGRWFRPPLLHSGATPAKKQGLQAHLDRRGYRWAPVTVDNQEWVYAAVYADARARGDEALARRVTEAYVEHLGAAFTFSEALSESVFGRQIPLVLLLHANVLNAEELPRVLSMLRERGYGFVSLPQALEDPAYARGDDYMGPRGLSWLQRWALEDGVHVPEEPREHAWLARAFRRIQQRRADEEAIRTTLDHYLQGHATGLASKFAAAFHPEARLLWVGDEELRTRTAESYIAGARGRPDDDEDRRTRRIAWIDAARDVATARVELDYPGVFFVDYMTLARTSDGWKIVSKAYQMDRSGALRSEATDTSDGPIRAGDAQQTDSAAIAAAGAAFSRAYVAGDSATIRQLYTEDSLLLPPGALIEGRDRVVRYFGPGPRRENVSHSMTSERLEISGDMAVDVGTWNNRWRIDGGPVQEVSDRYMLVWRKGEDGRWRIAYDMWHRPSS